MKPGEQVLIMALWLLNQKRDDDAFEVNVASAQAGENPTIDASRVSATFKR